MHKVTIEITGQEISIKIINNGGEREWCASRDLDFAPSDKSSSGKTSISDLMAEHLEEGIYEQAVDISDLILEECGHSGDKDACDCSECAGTGEGGCHGGPKCLNCRGTGSAGEMVCLDCGEVLK